MAKFGYCYNMLSVVCLSSKTRVCFDETAKARITSFSLKISSGPKFYFGFACEV